MNESIDYACPSCGRVLSAPVAWRGRTVACPVCGHRSAVPETGTALPAAADDIEDIDTAVPDIVFVERDAAPRVPPPAVPPRPGFFRRYRIYIIAGAVLAGLFGWWGSWKWYYNHYVKAEAIMKSRGYGHQLSAPLTNDPKVEPLVAAALAAEQRQFADPGNLDLSIALAAAYDAALKEIAHVQKERANHLLNNAAWLFATTPHLGLRDHPRALKLAESAVVGTCRKDSGYLDTLAEALSVNGRDAEALAAAREALGLKPDDPYLIGREKHFSEIAGR